MTSECAGPDKAEGAPCNVNVWDAVVAEITEYLNETSWPTSPLSEFEIRQIASGVERRLGLR